MKKMKAILSTLFLFSAVVFSFAFRGRVKSGDPVMDDIHKVEQQSSEAFAKGDSALFLKCYTSDACVMPPNAPLLCGAWGVTRFFKNAYQLGVRNAAYTSLGLFGQTADYVTQQGAFELFDGAGHSLRKGKVLLIWKKTTEGWKIFRESLNFDTPVASAPSNS